MRLIDYLIHKELPLSWIINLALFVMMLVTVRVWL